MKYAKDLTISIISYNCRDYLEECLDSIYGNKPGFAFDIIVVDNASTDGTGEMLKARYPEVILVENKKNTGFAAANNQAIRKSYSKYILLINSDCQVFENAIENLVKFMDKNHEAGITGPIIINSDGSIQLSCRKFPSFFSAAAHSILVNIAPNNPISRNYKLAGLNRDRPLKVDWVSGSCMIIRRAALEDTGLLDEKYFMYVEDLDICFRMWQKGWNVYFAPVSKVLHHIGGSSGSKRIKASLRMQKSVFYFFWKNYKKNIRVLLLPFLFFILATRFLLSILKSIFYREAIIHKKRHK